MLVLQLLAQSPAASLVVNSLLLVKLQTRLTLKLELLMP
jgi:hypothetical protein